jgi:PucR C-terminal helix-turn-helix domain/GGDEF-like domain
MQMSEGQARLLVQLRLRLPALRQRILELAERPGENGWYALEAHTAVTACLECWLLALERAERWSEPVPPAVGLQARGAARSGVSLALLQYVYVRARDMAWNVLLQEIERIPSSQQMLLVRQSSVATESLFDRVLAAIQDAYAAELARREQTPMEYQAGLVYRLLAGDLSVNPKEIRYDFDMQHVAIAAGGNVARRALETLADRAGCRLYCLPEQDGMFVAWLSRRGGLDLVVKRHLSGDHDLELPLAVGCGAQGLDGFCRTHRQAVEALMVAGRRPRPITFYADVELEAHLLTHQEFAGSLVGRYFASLDPILQKTLCVYYRAACNVAKASEALEVSPATIYGRLKKIAVIVGWPLEACHASLDLAVRAVDLGIPSTRPPISP